MKAVPALAATDRIVVASKIDTEGALLGQMIVAELTQLGLNVEDRTQLGPTPILRQAILADQIDIYPEYTGDAATFFHRENDPVWRDPAKAYAAARDLDARNRLVWLKPASADNSWAIALRRDLADTNHLQSLQDFAHYVNAQGRIRLAASAEFVESPGALPAFEKAYGFHLDSGQLLNLAGGDTSATIRAAAEGISGVNAAMAYGTDGALAALGLVVLSDDRHAQIVYQPAPVIRRAVLDAHPEIATGLNPVFSSLSLEVLQRLNAKIAVDGEDAHKVAADYLKQNGFTR